MGGSLGKKNNRRFIRNNRGQFLIESMLLMVVLIGLFMFITNYIRNEKLVSKLVENPLRSVATMTAFGVWDSNGCTSKNGNTLPLGKCHPNSFQRSLSSAPK